MNSLCTLVCECVTSSSQWIKHKSHYNACVWRNSFLLMFFFFFLISQSIIYQKKAQSASNYTRMRTQSASSIQKKPKPTTQGTHKRTSKYTKSIQRNPKKKNPKQPKSSKGPKQHPNSSPSTPPEGTKTHSILLMLCTISQKHISELLRMPLKPKNRARLSYQFNKKTTQKESTENQEHDTQTGRNA
jgi:hypothetical protein